MNDQIKPFGKLKPIDATERGETKNNHVVCVWVVCEDENGRKWKFPASSLVIEMKLHEE